MVDPAIIQAAMPEFPIDEIFYTDDGSQAVPSGFVVTTANVPHGQGRTFLWKMRFSNDQNNWYQEGFPPYSYDGTINLYAPTFYAKLYINATTMFFTYASFATSQTIYWQIVGYEKNG